MRPLLKGNRHPVGGYAGVENPPLVPFGSVWGVHPLVITVDIRPPHPLLEGD